MSAQKLIAADLHSLHLCWLVQFLSYLTVPSQTKTEQSCSQDKSNAKQNISTKEPQLARSQKKKVKSCITFTES